MLETNLKFFSNSIDFIDKSVYNDTCNKQISIFQKGVYQYV